ncbi:hypothetical protein [Sphingomonas sp. LaA6.9]|uniref:hypothetical protein n=1 Tax=Sphingomonas sp. LaA6.9 TaxID=2919914 RepID=UPI001F4F72BC|nr:hypothetical protein [Sphingomonas sp. LaA6.9]MCJ8158547.1 hypothetical protein [Sphingomonas sp. LaA6.9]
MTKLPTIPDDMKMEFVGPTVEDDVRRLIVRYGIDAVRDAVKKQAKKKRGRPEEKDIRELRPFLEQDARAWLEGRDPFAERSNYAIAQQFANERPGHSYAGTMTRIQKKLAQKRKFYVFAIAEALARDEYPYKQHLRALEAVATESDHEIWTLVIDRANGTLASYTRKHGEPDDSITMKQIEEGARNALSFPNVSKPIRLGILGSMTRKAPPTK